MNTEKALPEMQDAQLQERADMVPDDRRLPAEQILNEQDAEREENGNTAAPRFVP